MFRLLVESELEHNLLTEKDMHTSDVPPLSELPFVDMSEATPKLRFTPQTLKYPFYYEECAAGAHWGTYCALGEKCALCGLLLSNDPRACTSLVHPASTVVVYRCGHAFHSSCVVADGCPICIAEATEMPAEVTAIIPTELVE